MSQSLGEQHGSRTWVWYGPWCEIRLISGGPKVSDTYSSLGWQEACHAICSISASMWSFLSSLLGHRTTCRKQDLTLCETVWPNLMVGVNFFCKAGLVDLKQNQYKMIFCWAYPQAFVLVRGNYCFGLGWRLNWIEVYSDKFDKLLINCMKKRTVVHVPLFFLWVLCLCSLGTGLRICFKCTKYASGNIENFCLIFNKIFYSCTQKVGCTFGEQD